MITVEEENAKNHSCREIDFGDGGGQDRACVVESFLKIKYSFMINK